MTLVLQLPDNKEATLKATAQAQGVSAEQYVQQIVDHDLEESASPVATAQRCQISEVIREIWSDLPMKRGPNCRMTELVTSITMFMACPREISEGVFC